MRGEREQLAAFVGFILSNRSRRKALIDRSWRDFTIYYNREGGVKAGYPQDMQEAYAAIMAAGVPAR